MKKLNYYVAVISHMRPENVSKIMEIIYPLDPVFFVNKGEGKEYQKAGAKKVIECGTDIVEARNRAVKEAGKKFCIQVSDDLKSIKKVYLDGKKKIVEKIEFYKVCEALVMQLENQNSNYGGVAVTTNLLNYDGINISLDKLIVNDLICLRPKTFFDPLLPLKEDYGLCIKELSCGRPVVRLNNILCDFPHRQNKGGANTYRNTETEKQATLRLKHRWGMFVKDNPRRPGQVLLNYPLIRRAAMEFADYKK
jgi:hypothetical protein